VRAQAGVLGELGKRFADEPETALPYARALVALSPYDEMSRAALIRLLVSLRRADEAEQQYQLGVRMLKESGVPSSGALLQARRPVTTSDSNVARVPPAKPAVRTKPLGPVAGTLIGRDSEVSQLAEAFSNVAQNSEAAIVLVHGVAGIGKSCVLETAARLARSSGALLLESSAFESEVIRPFSLWIDALRKTSDDAAANVFGSTDFSAKGIDDRNSLFAALANLVSQEAADRQVVLIFDDIHWSDESSAAALHYVARMNRHRSLLGIIAGREGELRDNVPVQQAIRGMRRDGLLQELRLGPLPEDAVVSLIGERAPGVDGKRLGRECGGNPLLAIELARAENEGDSGTSLDELVQERLARFGVDGAEVLRWAAVLSPPIDLPTLERLTQLGSTQIGAVLESAERQAMLSSTDRGLRFSHELVARSVYNEISPLRRQFMHRSIAELLEQNTAVDLAYAADLAHHATQSGDAGLAARAMVSAGRLCLRFFANDEALNLARRGMQLTGQLPDAARVCVSIDLHDIMLSAAALENWEEAAREYVSLAEQALDHGATAHARLGYHMAAYVRWAHGQWSGAREETLQAERVTRGGSAQDHIIGMAETAKCLAMLERDLSQADAMLMEAQALGARHRVNHQAISAGLGMLRYHENRLDEAEELFKEARALCKAAGDRVSEFQANEYLVMIDFQRGRFEDAKSRCAELVTIGEKLRDGSEAPFSRALKDLCLYAINDESEALDSTLADLRIADAKHRLAYTLTQAALIDIDRGRTDDAIARAREALGYAELLERATETTLAHVALAQAYRKADDAPQAAQHIGAIAKLDASAVAAWARSLAEKLTAAQ
jgi:tetratricopeptide (TPR) repeat protein